MPLRELLASDYAVRTEEKVRLDGGRDGYVMDGYVYFTIPADNKEMIHMEQASIAYYMEERNYPQTTVPIPNVHGNWYTDYQGETYLVLRTKPLPTQEPVIPEGIQLAEFHESGTGYPYEPHFASSYGKWQQLWIDKLTMFEQKIESDARKKSTRFYQYLMDCLPYIVGLSENAIQYVYETEQDKRFHQMDQGVITFRRYRNQLRGSFIWMEDFLYDHPARDLAENIRGMMLNGSSKDEMISFLNDYHSARPISIFGWRLVYARLIFPVHIFDWLEKSFRRNDDDLLYQEWMDLMDKQTQYEYGVKNFFNYAGIDHESEQIPVLHWL
ncbi:hypothetical protein ACFOGI_14205 [Virgibacillus xinjiangensis]|uniref:Spore coat protein YutH n=1 Tax=Virgibacillus xinjiangensis TaxID=393090 RepID=A0ABV7CYC7_9BACI